MENGATSTGLSPKAAAHILATNIGVTLRQIIRGSPDPDLSAAVRDGAIDAITGTGGTDGAAGTGAISAVTELAASNPEVLGPTETHLLQEWLRRLREAGEDQ